MVRLRWSRSAGSDNARSAAWRRSSRRLIRRSRCPLGEQRCRSGQGSQSLERLLGLIVHRYRGRKSRYLGARKSAFQAVWTAVLVNLHPIGAALRAQAA
jgi:hypothetical protein